MKKFLERKRLNAAFKDAGNGHRLNEPSSSRRDVKTMNKNEVQHKSGPVEAGGAGKVGESHDRVSGVLFRCPALNEDSVLSKTDWEARIRQIVEELKCTDKILASIIAVKSLNPQESVKRCVELIKIYLTNLLMYPLNEKYKTIRMGNRNFKESIVNMEGALDFLAAVGFKEVLSDGETYLVYSKESSTANLESAIQSLVEINGIKLELDRDFRILDGKGISAEDFELTDDFYQIDGEELKKEQFRRSEKLENDKLLMTKKTKEKLRQKGRKALYTRIRVRLPNDLVVQGTFSVGEKFKCLRSLIEEKFDVDKSYTLMCPPSHVYGPKDDDKSFEDLDLQPAVLLVLKTKNGNITLKNNNIQNQPKQK